MTQHERVDVLKAIFKEFDKNGDGLITKDDLKYLLRGHTEEDVERMMKAIDDNADGVIDYNKFAEWLMADGCPFYTEFTERWLVPDKATDVAAAIADLAAAVAKLQRDMGRMREEQAQLRAAVHQATCASAVRVAPHDKGMNSSQLVTSDQTQKTDADHGRSPPRTSVDRHRLGLAPSQELPASYDEAMKVLGALQAEQLRESEDLMMKYQVDPTISQLLPSQWSKRLSNSVKINFQSYVNTLEDLVGKAATVHTAFAEEVNRIAQETHGVAVTPPLKGPKRCKAKARFKYSDDTGIAWYRLTDVVRATILYDTLQDMYNSLRVISASSAFELLEFNDRYRCPISGGYRDMQLVVRCQGVVCELQLNTHLMAAVKESSGHRSFEISRELKAAIEARSLERVHDILTWGSQELAENANESLQSIINDPSEGVMYKAAAQGQAEVVSYLLEYEGDPNIKSAANLTPLHAAMSSGHERVVWALLSQGYADYHISDDDGNPPLLHGLLMIRTRPDDERASRVVSLLAQWAGVDHMKQVQTKVAGELQKRYCNSTSLVNFAFDANINGMLEELNKFADPNSVDRNGDSALLAATMSGKCAAVDLLLQAGANPEQAESSGLQLWQLALNKGNMSIVHRLAAASGSSLSTVAESKAFGCTAADCLKLGFTAQDFRGGIFLAKDCMDANFSAQQCLEAEFSVKELKEIGFTVQQCIEGGFTEQQCREGGFAALECKASGFTALKCKESGFTAAQCLAAGFSAAECREASFTAQQCKEAGCTASQCKEAGFPVEEFRTAGFSVLQCMRSGFAKVECEKAGFTRQECDEASKSCHMLIVEPRDATAIRTSAVVQMQSKRWDTFLHANGSPNVVLQYSAEGDTVTGTHWKIITVAEDTFQIQSLRNNNFLCASGSDKIRMWESDNDGPVDGSYWKIVPASEGFVRWQNVRTQNFLHANGERRWTIQWASDRDGPIVGTYWKIQEMRPVQFLSKRFHTFLHANGCRRAVLQFNSDNDPVEGTRWMLVAVRDDVVQIRCLRWNMVLYAHGANQVIQWVSEKDGPTETHWKIIDEEDGYARLQNVHTRKFLHANGERRNIIQWGSVADGPAEGTYWNIEALAPVQLAGKRFDTFLHANGCKREVLQFNSNADAAVGAHWRVVPAGDDAVQIQCLRWNKFLYASDSQQVAQWESEDKDGPLESSHWKIIPATEGHVRLQHIRSQNFLHANGERRKIIQWASGGDGPIEGTYWKLQPLTPVQFLGKRFKTFLHANGCNTEVLQFSSQQDSVDGTRWMILPVDDEHVQIQSLRCNKVLYATDGHKVVLWVPGDTSESVDGALWKIVSAPEGHIRLQSTRTQKFIHANGERRYIIQWASAADGPIEGTYWKESAIESL